MAEVRALKKVKVQGETKNALKISIPKIFRPLFSPHRYKVFYGGRGSGKSWSFAEALVCIAYTQKKRILCAREFQTSIKDSVYALLADAIERMGLAAAFIVQRDSIRCRVTGSEFLFKGLRRNVAEIKSTEGIDICWVEEAQSTSADSWDFLIPTIRAPGSEIWVSFNPDQQDGATQTRFVNNTPPDSVVCKVNFDQNPFFPKVLDMERQYMLQTDPDAYSWVWEGNCRTVTEAQIFRDKYRIDRFNAPKGTRFYYGMDFGFATDPNALVRCWIDQETDSLMIDYEAFGFHIELDEMEGFISQIPDVRRWTIKADAARPETISYLTRKKGGSFDVEAAKKWKGCIEDGVAYLKSFRGGIVIHERCKHMIEEAALYSYKQDRITNKVLPIIVDKNNHGWDAVRYALDGKITQHDSVDQLAALARG